MYKRRKIYPKYRRRYKYEEFFYGFFEHCKQYRGQRNSRRKKGRGDCQKQRGRYRKGYVGREIKILEDLNFRDKNTVLVAEIITKI
jgi:hypothetical protein